MKKAIDYLDKERSFNKGLQDLKSAPVDMVPDFRKAVSKDLPVEKINKLGDVIPQKSGADFMADQLIRDARQNAVKEAGNTLNYNQLRKEFAAKNGVGRKILGAVPLLGAAATFATTGDASAAADELPGDLPLVGQAYEAIRPETAGDPEAEKQLLSEVQAKKDYNASPAHLARLQALQNIK